MSINILKLARTMHSTMLPIWWERTNPDAAFGGGVAVQAEDHAQHHVMV